MQADKPAKKQSVTESSLQPVVSKSIADSGQQKLAANFPTEQTIVEDKVAADGHTEAALQAQRAKWMHMGTLLRRRAHR